MNATTLNEAKRNLERLINQVNADAEPMIMTAQMFLTELKYTQY